MFRFTATACFVFALSTATPTTRGGYEAEITIANVQFASKMYDIVRENQGNILISPLSAHACLSMFYQGTAGSTRDACSATLNVADPSQAAEGYSLVMDKLNNADDISIDIANKIYTKKEVTLKPYFLDIVSGKFKSEVENLDFADSENARAVINAWVKDKTHEKIPELFGKNDIKPATTMVLLNAVYFKGGWFQQFNSTSTRKENFYTTNEIKVEAQMMNGQQRILYKEDSNLYAKIIEVPFKNRDFGMVFILPNERDGLKQVEEKLVNADLSSIFAGASYQKVDVSIPKFGFEQKTNLKEVLQKMGLGLIFTTDCDLSEMAEGGKDMHVDKAIQKTYIKVDETGCEAAAATAMTIVVTSTGVYQPVLEFKADHPFIFLLSHKTTQGSDLRNILFYGRITNPLE